jgi:hypothetical protein
MGNLEEAVKAERKKLVDAALADGSVDRVALDRLDRLQRLAKEAKQQRRWLIPTLAFILLTVLIGLLIKKQAETEVELDLVVTELHFRSPRQGLVTKDQFARALHASGLDGIEVVGAAWSGSHVGTCSLDVELSSGAQKGDAITVPALLIPKDWEIGISRVAPEINFEFSGPARSGGEDFLIRAVVRGKGVLSSDCAPDGKTHTVHLNGSGSLTMRIGTATSLRCESGLPVQFAPQIEFQNLGLYANERIQGNGAPIDRRRSSVASGTVYLDALNAKAVQLRPFEDISFRSSNGYIQALNVPSHSKSSNEELHLQAHATVQKMTRGTGKNERSQMPNWLELITAQTGIALLWASIVYVFGIIYAVLRWLKVAD